MCLAALLFFEGDFFSCDERQRRSILTETHGSEQDRQGPCVCVCEGVCSRVN